MKRALVVGFLICFSLAAQAPAPPAIHPEDALALAKLQTRQHDNASTEQRLQDAYRQVIQEKQNIAAEIETAKIAALKNAGATRKSSS